MSSIDEGTLARPTPAPRPPTRTHSGPTPLAFSAQSVSFPYGPVAALRDVTRAQAAGGQGVGPRRRGGGLPPGAALWDEVKDSLSKSALDLSGGQQQRLCIARAIAVRPDVILMDEPCSALDPIATRRIEELIGELKSDYTIVIVTHNLAQAARVADRTAFFTAEVTDAGDRHGVLVEAGPTSTIFTDPGDPRTADYVAGRTG